MTCSEESEEEANVTVQTRVRTSEKRGRPESSIILSGNNPKNANHDSASDHELIGGEESLFAAFCQNTTVIHDDFKRYAQVEIRNTTEILDSQKKVIFYKIFFLYSIKIWFKLKIY